MLFAGQVPQPFVPVHEIAMPNLGPYRLQLAALVDALVTSQRAMGLITGELGAMANGLAANHENRGVP